MTKKEQLAALKERYDRGRITKFQYGRMRMKIMAGESPSRVKTKDKKTESKARKKPSEVVKSRVSDLRSKVKEAAKEKAKEPKKTAKNSIPPFVKIFFIPKSTHHPTNKKPHER